MKLTPEKNAEEVMRKVADDFIQNGPIACTTPKDAELEALLRTTRKAPSERVTGYTKDAIGELIERCMAASHDERLSAGALYREAADALRRLLAGRDNTIAAKDAEIAEQWQDQSGHGYHLTLREDIKKWEGSALAEAITAKNAEIARLREALIEARQITLDTAEVTGMHRPALIVQIDRALQQQE